MVYNKISRPKWDNHTVVYSVKTKKGKEFFLVDVETKQKTSAFNHDKFAERLSEVLDDSLSGYDLPVYNVSFSAKENTLSFSARRSTYTCNFGDDCKPLFY